MIVDEVQYAPGLFRHLNAAIDANRHKMGAFLLTGSQPFTLMRSVAAVPPDSVASLSSICRTSNPSLSVAV